MIALMRKSLQGNAYRIFLWMFMIFMIIGGFSVIDFGGDGKWAIKVYKQKLSEEDWHHLLVMAQKQLDYFKQHGINWEKDESVETEVLRQAVSDLLVRHGAHEIGLRIPADILQEHIEMNLRSLPDHFFHQDGTLDVNLFERAIAPKKFDGFIGEVEHGVKSDVLFKLVKLATYVPKFELQMQYNEDYANKVYSILTFSFHKSLEEVKKEKVSDKILERFYKKTEHGSRYKTPEKRAGMYWTFTEADYGIKPTEKEIADYYKKNKRAEFIASPGQVQVRVITFSIADGKKQEARDLAEKTYKELEAKPEEFAAVAKKLDSDKTKRASSQLTAMFARDTKEYDTLFVDTAFEKLSKDGQISAVIKTKAGYQILQRVKRKNAEYKNLKDVSSQISEKLTKSKFVTRFQQDARRIAGQARYNVKSLESFIKRRGGKESMLDLEVRKASAVSNHLFMLDKNRYDVFMDGNKGILLKCTEIEKSVLKPFDSVKDQVTADYYREEAKKHLEKRAQDSIKEAATVSFEDLAKKYDAHLETAKFEYKDGQVQQDPVLQRYEIMQKAKLLQAPGELVDVHSKSESLLIRLDSIASVDKKLFEEKQESMHSILSHKSKFQAKDSFIASLYRHAKLNNKIDINEELLKKVSA